MKLILNPTRLITFLFLLAIISLISCKKEISGGTGNPQEEEFASRASSEADAESEIFFNQLFDDVMGVNDDLGMAGLGVFGRANTSGTNFNIARTDTIRCFTVSLTHLNAPDVFPVRVVLDFGTGCVGRDGHLRSGKIITIYTGRLIVPGAKATTHFENFKFDEIKVEGVHEITNLSSPVSVTNPFPPHKWKVVVEGARLTKPNSNYTEWNSQKTIAQLEGMLTPFIPLDDIYKIEGSANGKVKRDNIIVAWKAEITEPFIKKFSCRWIVKGRLRVARMTLSSNSPWVAILDYGNGDCNNRAVISINGVLHEITLP